MAEKRRSLRIPALVLVVLAAGFFAFAWTSRDAALGDFFPDRRQGEAWSVLEEIRDMEELETAVYEMRMVFPFDFTARDDVDWAFLKLQYDRSPDTFLTKTDPAWHPDGVLPEDWDHGELNALCRDVGIDPGRPDYRFVVIAAGVRAGVDIRSWSESLEAGGVSVDEDDAGRKFLRLTAPPVEVTSFVVRDRDASAEGYPDVPLSPEKWKRLVEALEPMLREAAFETGLLETADEEARLLLTDMFGAAGYDDVQFLDS